MLYLFFLLNIATSNCLLLKTFAWNYSNLKCRDNSNAGLDWWFLYKPPDDGNFTYIASDLATRWRPSHRTITDNNNMLFYTLAPMYTKNNVDRVAVMVFENKDSDENVPGSSTRGVLMADDVGGLYIGYSVPFLADVAFDRPKFPSSELPYGHLITCMSLSLRTLNEFATYLKHAGPELVSLQIPNSLMTALPAWVMMKSNSADSDWFGIPKAPLQFISKHSTIHGKLLVRIPGQKLCLYTEFAKQRDIILDVYGPNSKRMKNFCEPTYGVRSIPSISLNIHDEVVRYIDNKTDRTRFAVSTASNWQRRGHGGIQYWTCTSGLNRDDNTANGGILLCIANYEIWANFDTLKVKEPECSRETN